MVKSTNREVTEAMSLKNFNPEFKIESARLVLDQGYSVSDAFKAVGVGETAMRRWVNQLKEEREGIISLGSTAVALDQQRI